MPHCYRPPFDFQAAQTLTLPLKKDELEQMLDFFRFSMLLFDG